MEHHGVGRRGLPRYAGLVAVVIVAAALALLAGCAAFPVPDEGELLFNAKRFDHFTCTNLTAVVANVEVRVFRDAPEPNQPPVLFGTYYFSVPPYLSGGFVPALEEAPPVPICRVECNVRPGAANEPVTYVLEIPEGTPARWHSASFCFGPADNQRTRNNLTGWGVLYRP